MPTTPNAPLISAEALHALLDRPDLRLLDATWFLPGAPRTGQEAFLEAHIPGAQFFDIEEIADTTSPLPQMAPPPEKLASRLRRMGVGDGAEIVVYDGTGIFSAARVWWTLRLMGKEAVRVLDGGLPAWVAAGYPTEDGPARKPSERHFTARLRRDLVRDLDDMRRLVAGGGAQIVDARPAGRFAGHDPEPRAGLRLGHLPGALSAPYSAFLTPDGRMKPPAELAAAFAAAGVDPAQRMVCTCGSGVSAAVVALAAAQLGNWTAAVYDGSWAEWGGRADTPIETGA